MVMSDATGAEFVSVFDDCGKLLLGSEAKMVAEQRESACSLSGAVSDL